MRTPERTKPEAPATASPNRSKTASERSTISLVSRVGYSWRMIPTDRPVPPAPMNVLLEDEHPAEAQPGELEGGGDAGDSSADDDGVDGARRHGRRRTGSPRRIAPVRSTRA